MDQELVRMVAWNGFSELLQRPLCGRMRGHVVVENTAAADFHDKKDEQHLEPDSHGNQKVAGNDPLGMILDEGSPVLRRRSGAPGPVGLLWPVLANSSWRNQNAKL